MQNAGRARKLRWAFLAVVGVALATALAWVRWHGMPGVAARALADADRYELLSLRPFPFKPEFYNHEILGRTTVTDAATRQRLNAALQSGVRESDGTAMACFNPRHGIRVTRAGETTDFLICFECRQVQVWRDGKKIATFLTSASPQSVFDEVLQKAHVPLAAEEP
ncbi:MAG: hypothetical protein JWP03_4187 [Phycisphaerales bacterium]|nr:hypothetical protein [Phycisphaerales bacterium]